MKSTSDNSTDLVYAAIVDLFASAMSKFGLTRKRDDRFERKVKRCTQFISVARRLVHKEQVDYVTFSAGFNYADVEKTAAELQKRAPRKGFSTCSVNIGLLMPTANYSEWPIASKSDPNAVAADLAKIASDFVLPFWERYSTVDGVLSGFESKDPVLCRGADFPWRHAALYVLTEEPKKAVELLTRRLEDAASIDKPRFRDAIARLMKEWDLG